MFADTITVNSLPFNKLRNFGGSSEFRRVANTSDDQKTLAISHTTDKKDVSRSLVQMKLKQASGATEEIVTVNFTVTRKNTRIVITDAEIKSLFADFVSFFNDSTTQDKLLGLEV
jgi:hypothetical protein